MGLTAGPNGEKRIPLYIPPPLPDDDEHIFETLAKGINFDKYDQIAVECTGNNAPKTGITRLIFSSSCFSFHIFRFMLLVLLIDDQVVVGQSLTFRSPLCFSFELADINSVFKTNVKKANYDKPTPIQKWAIPIILSGRDLMACAQTGSGKTVCRPVHFSFLSNLCRCKNFHLNIEMQ